MARLRDLRARRGTARAIAALPPEVLPPGSSARRLSAQNGVIVLVVDTEPEQIVRVATDGPGRATILRHGHALLDLHDDPACASIAAVLPRVLHSDPEGAWLAESSALGEPEETLTARGVPALPAASLLALDLLHDSTAEAREVDEADLHAWVGAPVRLLRPVVRGDRATRGLDAVERYLRLALLGRRLTITRIHGDATPGNFLFSPDGERVTGIIDWEASRRALPNAEVAHYLISERCWSTDSPLGANVVDVLRRHWSTHERAMVAEHARNAEVAPETAALLAWLLHVSNNLRKAPRYGRNPLWVRSNVSRVLVAIEAEGLLPLRPDEAPTPAATTAAGSMVAGSMVAGGEALVTDLTLNATEVWRLLVAETAAEHWLDAFLLSAAASQMVDDTLTRVHSVSGRAAAVLRPSRHLAMRAAGRAAGLLRRTIDISRALTPPGRALVEHRAELLRLTTDLAATARADAEIDPATVRALQIRARRSADIATRAAGLLGDQVVRLPACFRSFDQDPADVDRLVDRYVERFPERDRSLLLVGVRTSGSYLAPLAAARFRALGFGRIDLLTIRPGEQLTRPETARVATLAAQNGMAVVLDDPPVMGNALAEVAAAIEAAGLPRDSVLLMVAVMNEEATLPAGIAQYPSVILAPAEWELPRRLEARAVEETVGRMLAPTLRLERLEARATAVTRMTDPRRHRRMVFDAQLVDTTTGEATDGVVVAEGVGIGLFGRHAVAAADALKGWVPEVLGFEAGVLYQFLPRLEEAPVPPEVVADYAIARSRALRVLTDRSRVLPGRRTVTEAATELVGASLRRADMVVRLTLVHPVLERLMRVDEPSIVDGTIARNLWVAASEPAEPSSWRKIDFADSFSNRELLSYDAVYDVAAPLDDDPTIDRGLSRAARTRWEESTGGSVEPERWLMHRLVHIWRLRRLGASQLWFARHASSALQDYVAEVFLFDLDARGGPWCALDVDGVLETDVFGATVPLNAGAMSLRALVAHGYRVVIATGRSTDDVRDRCAAWPLAGGVAEYGSAIVVDGGKRVVDLRSPDEAALMDRVRVLLSDRAGVHLDPAYRHAVRAFRLDSKGGRRGLGRDDLAACFDQLGRRDTVQVIPGECQSDFAPMRITKATGVRELLARLDPGAPAGDAATERPLAFAIGDGVADLPLLELAELAATPQHSGLQVPPRVVVTRASYQAGLAEATARLLDHAPGSCPVCEVDRTAGSIALYGLLSVLEAGTSGIPERLVGVGLAARRFLREGRGRGAV